ncbi:MAG: hypothetical protein DRN92_00715 [Thermoproteota archaeon]|nr:MAG: hypothetical protein DRN92_00715 [Candidatus Korarchaeota archaeon]
MKGVFIPERDPRDAIRFVLRQAMEKGLLGGILGYRRNNSGLIYPYLFTSKEELSQLVPISPVISGYSMATLSSWITTNGYSGEKIAVLLKPCETRAVIELSKFDQVSLENLLLMTVECLGTYHVLDFIDMIEGGESPEESLLKSYYSREDDAFREACKICMYPKAPYSDLNLCFISLGGKGLVVETSSEKGYHLMEKLGFSVQELEDEALEVIDIRKERRKEFLEKSRQDLAGPEKINEFFQDCINCHNCMEVCPICFCEECFFDADRYEYVTRRFLNWSPKEGTFPLPEAKIQFHLGRALHMSTSCITCGLCQQACPKQIKLSEFFILLAEENQALFDYVPGRDPEEKPPIREFYEEELEEYTGGT